MTDPGARPRVAVIVRFGLNAGAWEVRHRRGEVADRSPYGYHLAEEWATLEWSHDHAEGAVGRWWRLTVRHVMGFDLVHVWRNRDVLSRADAVWTHTEREHLGVAFLKALRPHRYRAVSIAQSVWLWDLWPRLSRPRIALFRRLLRRHAVEVVLSRENRTASRAAAPGRAVLRLPFGTHFARRRTPEAASSRRVVVVGNDRHRDWALLDAVCRLLPDAEFDIVSLADEARSRSWPANVRVRAASQRTVLDDVYAGAAVVALPLRPNLHASGCTVAIEAVSAGVPVVATDAGGIDEYLAGAAGSLVPVGDAAAFAAALASVLDAPDAGADPDAASRGGMSQDDYVARLRELTLAALAGRDPDPRVEAFEPIAAAPVRGKAAAS